MMKKTDSGQKPLGLGVLGLGEGRSIISAALASEIWQLVNICDLNEALCLERQREFSLPRHTTRYEDLLAEPERLPFNHPARQWQNLIWTCHDIERDWPTDGQPPQKLDAMHEICLDNLRRFRDGQPLRFIMDRRRFDLST